MCLNFKNSYIILFYIINDYFISDFVGPIIVTTSVLHRSHFTRLQPLHKKRGGARAIIIFYISCQPSSDPSLCVRTQWWVWQDLVVAVKVTIHTPPPSSHKILSLSRNTQAFHSDFKAALADRSKGSIIKMVAPYRGDWS